MTNSSYEEMPYATVAFRDADPNRLAAIARLYGVDTPSPTEASVLEIGCGTGGNIVHIAQRFSSSRCVGVDISERHIEEGQKLVAASGVTNVELRCGDIGKVALGHGEFDYIICHGVYSWVSADLRQEILQLMSSSLSENGVAFLSYNVLPGWRQRGAIRDIMLSGALHRTSTTGKDYPEERLAGAMDFLKLVGSVRNKEGDMYGSYINETIERFKGSHPSYLFHEYLEEINEPVLFSDFMASADLHGLQFVSEAKPSLMSADNLGPQVSEYIGRLGTDIVAQEQCLDMLRNRMFRETILCRSSHSLKRDLKASVFKTIHFATDYRRVDGTGDSAVFREVASDQTVTTPRDEHAAVLEVIGGAGYAGVTFGEIMELANAALPGRSDERALMHILVRLWRAGFIDVALERAPIVSVAQGVARISRLASHQAQSNESLVTALQHRSFVVTDAERAVLRACDGAKSFDEVLVAANGSLNSGEGSPALVRLLERGFFLEPASATGV